MSRDREAVDREARVRALRVRGETPFGARSFGQAGRQLAEVGPERLEVGVSLPAGAFQFAFRPAGDAHVGELLAEDAEA